MMHYAQVILEAKSLGCDETKAKDFARKVVTAAALLAVMPEEVLKTWNDREKRSDENDAIVRTMARLGAEVPEKVA
ncbi:MAG: hypothetical protein Q4D38_11785 [Planctomycetia bacterium]|nr:hypothetical protein [Planctomycetia bacterium]